MFNIHEVFIFVSNISQRLLMRKFTLLLFFLFFLSASMNIYAQSEKKPLIVESEVTQLVLTIDGNTIRIQDADKDSTLEIYNILGVQISSIKIDSADKTVVLTLPKGCYMLKIGDIVRKVAIK